MEDDKTGKSEEILSKIKVWKEITDWRERAETVLSQSPESVEENLLLTFLPYFSEHGSYKNLPDVEKHALYSPFPAVKELARRVGTEILLRVWMEVLEEEHKMFEEKRTFYEKEYKGKWIALVRGKVIAAQDSLDILLVKINEIQRKEGRFQAYIPNEASKPL